MKKPEYLSPSALHFAEKNLDDYYIRYGCIDSIAREPQTQPMSVGSAFDAYAKSHIYEKLFGKNHDPKYNLDSLFESQVELHNRDWARIHGKIVFDKYVEYGCMATLMLELNQSIGTPRFEFDIRGSIETIENKSQGIPLLGKPDIFYINSEGTHVIQDFKVNGYCSEWGASPMKGYIRLYDGSGGAKMHKDCSPMKYKGMMINIACFLETLNADWADQLSTYSWLMGETIGSENPVGIDQIACKKGNIRVAAHRSRVSNRHQVSLLERYRTLWKRWTSGHFFTEMTLADSLAKESLLQERAKTMRGDGSDKDDWFKRVL